MSDNIPFEIQVEIMKRLPVKSLIQFRSVSKTWKSVIDSSDFVTRYGVRHANLECLVVGYGYSTAVMNNYVSVVDDHSFPRQKVSVTIPQLVDALKSSRIIGSSHGLYCLYGVHPDCPTRMTVIWNVSISKAFGVVMPTLPPPKGMYSVNVSFGVCRGTNEPKIVKIIYIEHLRDVESTACIPRQVEVFTLSTGVWKCLDGRNLPRKSIYFGCCSVANDGALYWVASDRNPPNSGRMMISFDLTSEEFREIRLPDRLVHQHGSCLSISKLRESVVLLERRVDAGNTISNVWMMEHESSSSFTKLFAVDLNTPDASLVLGFRKSGGAILIVAKDESDGKLVVYEPDSKRFYDLGIEGLMFSFSVHPYLETLLLLDQPNLKVYNDDVEALNFHKLNLNLRLNYKSFAPALKMIWLLIGYALHVLIRYLSG